MDPRPRARRGWRPRGGCGPGARSAAWRAALAPAGAIVLACASPDPASDPPTWPPPLASDPYVLDAAGPPAPAPGADAAAAASPEPAPAAGRSSPEPVAVAATDVDGLPWLAEDDLPWLAPDPPPLPSPPAPPPAGPVDLSVASPPVAPGTPFGLATECAGSICRRRWLVEIEAPGALEVRLAAGAGGRAEGRGLVRLFVRRVTSGRPQVLGQAISRTGPPLRVAGPVEPGRYLVVVQADGGEPGHPLETTFTPEPAP